MRIATSTRQRVNAGAVNHDREIVIVITYMCVCALVTEYRGTAAHRTRILMTFLPFRSVLFFSTCFVALEIAATTRPSCTAWVGDGATVVCYHIISES